MNLHQRTNLLLGRPVRMRRWRYSYLARLEEYFNVVDYSRHDGSEVYLISSGVNFLRPPSAILRSIVAEVSSMKYLNCYCGPLGESILRAAAMFYEDSLKSSSREETEAVVTTGGAEGLRLTADYLRSRCGVRKVLLAGPQYSIVPQTFLSKGISVEEIVSSREGTFLPSAMEIEEALSESAAHAVFLTEPNNPSGEQHSTEDFRKIVRAMKAKCCHLILDKVSSDFDADPKLLRLEYGKVLDQEDAWDLTYVVDSLSKRRALSGLRFGYVIGREDFRNYSFEKRYGGCPPLVGVEGISLDLAYSAHLQRGANQGAYEYTDLMQVERYRSLNDQARNTLFHRPSNETVEQYRAEVVNMYQCIFENREYIINTLRPYILDMTSMTSGFNFLLKVGIGKTYPSTFPKMLFKNTRVAIYPLHCFFLDHLLPKSKTCSGAIWFRVSCASNSNVFHEAVDRLGSYLSRIGSRQAQGSLMQNERMLTGSNIHELM